MRLYGRCAAARVLDKAQRPVEALARRGLGRGAAVASPVARRFKPGRLGPLWLEEAEVDRRGAQPHLPKEFRREPALGSARARSARVKHFCARTTHSHRSKPTLASLPAPSAFLTHHPALITFGGSPGRSPSFRGWRLVVEWPIGLIWHWVQDSP